MAINTPTCPFCNYAFDDEELFYGEYAVGKTSLGDQEDSELKCPNLDCKKTFYVRCIHRLEFIAIDSDGDELR